MRTTEIEVRDPNTNTIPIDVRFDPETEIGELNHYLINQDGNEITITLEMAASLLTAIKRLELSRPQRHSGRWEDNFKTVAEPVQEPVAWRYNSNGDWIYKDRKVWDDAEPLYAAPVQPLKQEPVPWEYCPECGSLDVQHEEGNHKQCARCFQEWFSDVDYSDVVQQNLNRLYAAPVEPVKQEPVAKVVLNLANQITMQKPNGDYFDVSKHVGDFFYAAPVRTKDLTADEINELFNENSYAFARAVIAADRELNK